jgi:hypothetical protein
VIISWLTELLMEAICHRGLLTSLALQHQVPGILYTVQDAHNLCSNCSIAHCMQDALLTKLESLQDASCTWPRVRHASRRISVQAGKPDEGGM